MALNYKNAYNYRDLGYKYLLQNNQLDYFIDLTNEFTKKRFQSKHNFFGVKIKDLENCGIQFLIQNLIGHSFNESVLIALGRGDKFIKSGLPNLWLKILQEKKGFIAETFHNKLRWIFFILKWYFYGNFVILKTFYKGIKNSNKYSDSQFVYFDSLSKKNVPKNMSKHSFTIIDWYLNYFKPSNHNIYHDVKERKPLREEDMIIKYSDFPIRLKISRLAWIHFLIHSFLVSLKSFFALFTGDFLHAILLKEYPLIYLSTKAKSNNLALKYFFHNSTRLFRPLWTYNAEKKGSEIILYYYSTNNSPLKLKSSHFKDFGSKKIMTWNTCYIWDSNQENYLKKYMPTANFKKVGPIWFESCNKRLPCFGKGNRVISVFDIQTYKEEFYQTLGIPDRYITTKNMTKFQNDIHKVLNNVEKVKVILKRKRASRKGFHDESYLSHLRKIYNGKKFIQISPDFSAKSIIKKSYLTISFPGTSTALISKNDNIKSIYYDPIKEIDSNDKTLLGIKLVSGIDELYEYIDEII